MTFLPERADFWQELENQFLPREALIKAGLVDLQFKNK